MKLERKLSATKLSLENNMPMFWVNAPVVTMVKVMTGAFSQNVGKVISEVKWVTDNFSICAAATEKPLN